MEVISGRIVGQLIVTHDSALYGLVEGDAWVMSGGKLFLYGLVTGNLHIADTGSAFIHGAVDGTVINNGGYVEVFGTIGKAAGFGATHIAPSARVVR